MPRLVRLVLSLCLVAGLGACQLAGPKAGANPSDVTPDAIAGDAIEVTALDSPAPTGSPSPASVAAEGEPTAPMQQGTPQPSEIAPEPAPESAPEPVAEPAPQPDLSAPVPEVKKSDQQRACEKKGGKWAKAGKGDFRICIFDTRDGGKQCTRESQCEGVCLARSGTCSPFKPLIGCNEILQDNGARVTLCIE